MSGTTSYLKHKIRHCKDPLKKKNLQKTLDYVLRLEEREKPKEVCGDGEEFICPNPKCNYTFCICEVENKAKYCPNCGQKLDWSDK